MAILMTADKAELIATCDCGCEDAFHIKVYEEEDIGVKGFLTFMKSDFDTEYSKNPWRAFKIKMKKIWMILRGQDYCYSDVIMSKEDFERFKEYINQF
ncbi:hypothetical protein SAMN02910339_01333 [Lachnospiraceae bacterium YSD2013]|nr:hypothetical protein SAMN02910339_01333 [Lachnospiraceae bacterium YSD2013]